MTLLAERAHENSLPVGEALAVVAVAFVVASVAYAVVENPVRHLRISPWRSVALGGAIIGGTLALLSAAIAWA